ncbi:MAG: hypothetical protein ACREA3_02915 [Nitrosotalea sp.]
MILFKTSVLGFEPKTAGHGDEVKRKEELRDAILKEIKDPNARKNCKGKDLSLTVCFNLYKDPKQPSKYEKDLDNLLKILLDVLPEHIDNSEKRNFGLGLIEDNNDYKVFEIHCEKKLVNDITEEGLDVEISEHIP